MPTAKRMKNKDEVLKAIDALRDESWYKVPELQLLTNVPDCKIYKKGHAINIFQQQDSHGDMLIKGCDAKPLLLDIVEKTMTWHKDGSPRTQTAAKRKHTRPPVKRSGVKINLPIAPPESIPPIPEQDMITRGLVLFRQCVEVLRGHPGLDKTALLKRLAKNVGGIE